MLSMPAISGGRPATVTPNTTSSRPVMRPSRMAQAACSMVLSVRPCRRASRLSAAVSVSLSASVICSGAPACARDWAAPHGWLLPARPKPPARPRRRWRDPAPRSMRDSRDRGSPAAAPRRRPGWHKAEQLAHQHRGRPAVHQQVMVGEHQPMQLRLEPDQRKAQQRRRAQDRTARRDPLPRCGSTSARGPPRQATTGRSCARAPPPATR